MGLVSQLDYSSHPWGGRKFRKWDKDYTADFTTKLSHDTLTRLVQPGIRVETEMTGRCTDWISGTLFSRITGNIIISGTRKIWLSSRLRNRSIKSQNGNGVVNHLIKIYHWNKGNGWWEGRVGEIEQIIAAKTLDLLYISEVNLRNEISDRDKLIEGYTMILPKTSVSHGYARLILLIKEEIEFKLQENLMSNVEPSIWIKLKINGRKSITVGGNYREHKLLLQQQPNTSGSTALQQRRWEATVRGWVMAAKEERCFLIGDINLDYSRWLQPEQGHVRMNSVKTEIETQGFLPSHQRNDLASGLVSLHHWSTTAGQICLE